MLGLAILLPSANGFSVSMIQEVLNVLHNLDWILCSLIYPKKRMSQIVSPHQQWYKTMTHESRTKLNLQSEAELQSQSRTHKQKKKKKCLSLYASQISKVTFHAEKAG